MPPPSASARTATGAAVAAPLPPLLRGQLLLGHLLDMRRDMLGFLLRVQRDFPEAARVRLLTRDYYVFHQPEALKHILQENNANYRKSPNYEKMKIFLGEGLLTSEGDFWRRQRRIAQPAFHRQRLAALAERVAAAADTAVERLRGTVRRGGPASIDVASEMMRLSLDAVSTALFTSEQTDDDAARIAAALAVAQHDAQARIESLIDWPLFVPTRLNRAARRAVADLDRILFRMIESHRRASPRPDDLLTLLLEARDADTGEGMSDRELRDEAMTLFLAGHETTAVALSWTLFLLATHPEVMARLRDELGRVLGGRAPTLADFKLLPFLAQVIDESMRLYPPAWVVERQSIGPDVVSGFRVPARAAIVLCTYAVHRNEALWPEPLRFDPERFAPERAGGRPRYAYLPFGGGPRQCIGKDFALMELMLALPRLVMAFDYRVDSSRPIEMNPQITLRAKDGIWMFMTEREAG